MAEPLSGIRTKKQQRKKKKKHCKKKKKEIPKDEVRRRSTAFIFKAVFSLNPPSPPPFPPFFHSASSFAGHSFSSFKQSVSRRLQSLGTRRHCRMRCAASKLSVAP